MIGTAAAVLLALGGCPDRFRKVPGRTQCDFPGYTFSSVDDTVCSATTNGFDCCLWLNATGGDLDRRFYSNCYDENTWNHMDQPCDNSLAETQTDSGIVYSRNCSDHTPATTTTTPASTTTTTLAQGEYSCPADYPIPREWGITSARYCNQNQIGSLLPDNALHVTNTTQFTREFLCQPATTVYSWCTAALTGSVVGNGPVVKCFDNTANIAEVIAASAGSIVLDSDMTFAKDVQIRDAGTTTMATIDCFPPAEQNDNGLSTGAVAGIAVGAVAFVGLAAAAAVCL